MQRRHFLSLAATPLAAQQQQPIALGNRRELFLDHFLTESSRNVQLRLATPVEKEIVLKMDRPWEGPFSGYFTALQEPGRIRLYYRGLPEAGRDGRAAESTCYAESTDGITFTKPPENRILQADPPWSHNFSPFLDSNPDTKSQHRYKALSGIASSGLRAWSSPDGLHWKPLFEAPVFPPTRLPMFDSQNLAHWSELEGLYVAYVRRFKPVEGFGRIRWIARSTSKDFKTWTGPEDMDIAGLPPEHLYTSQLAPYPRAPHITIGIAARFLPGRQVISEAEAKEIGVHPSYFKDTSDSVLLTTRGQNKIDRTFREAFLRPGHGLNHWVSRDNYPALNTVQTRPDELSFYVNRHYGQPTAHLQRFTLRTDGFASLEANAQGGEWLSKPLTFTGTKLELNFATSAAGSIKVELQNPDQSPIEGYTLNESDELIGDRLSHPATWQGREDLSPLQGRPLRILLTLRDANLFSLHPKRGQ
jgi:hypothetical protein